MSGKSTLLRSTGLNVVLAMAGAPVRASRFEISELTIGCSIGTRDSLLEGKSRFRAEVERLRNILDLAHNNNEIVLLDEVLGGTNSHDRYVATKAILERLLQCRTIALITTHDLALAELDGERGDRAVNAHFSDFYENGEMQFDYKLRPGVLSRTNGLQVVAAFGLL
jgi:DNA mismatch repair ATPase MutS